MATIQKQSKPGTSLLSEEPIVAKRSRFSWWSRRIDSPSYEVVGPVERFDLRDAMASRTALVPGTETTGNTTPNIQNWRRETSDCSAIDGSTPLWRPDRRNGPPSIAVIPWLWL